MPSRRQFLAASTLSLVAGTGCIGDSTVLGAAEGDGGVADSTDDTDATDATDGADDNGTETSDAGDDVLFTVTDGDEEVELATYDDVASVGEVERSRRTGGYFVPITLTDDGATAFADGLDAIGAFEDPTAHEIRTRLDGEVIYTATLGADLAAAVEAGDWGDELLVQFDDRETAEEMRAALGA